jgi:hypothetical protein
MRAEAVKFAGHVMNKTEWRKHFCSISLFFRYATHHSQLLSLINCFQDNYVNGL